MDYFPAILFFAVAGVLVGAKWASYWRTAGKHRRIRGAGRWRLSKRSNSIKSTPEDAETELTKRRVEQEGGANGANDDSGPSPTADGPGQREKDEADLRRQRKKLRAALLVGQPIKTKSSSSLAGSGEGGATQPIEIPPERLGGRIPERSVLQDVMTVGVSLSVLL